MVGGHQSVARGGDDMSVEVVTEAGEIRRRSILGVLGVVGVFLPIAALTSDTTVEQAAYACSIVPVIGLYAAARERWLTQSRIEQLLLALGTVLVSVLFLGVLGEAASIDAVVAAATSFAARNSLMLAAGAFLLLGPRRGLTYTLVLLIWWIAGAAAVATNVGSLGDLVPHLPDFVRAFISTIVTVAILWALTSQNVVWASGEAAARKQAHRDPLTGLANRRRLLEQMEDLLNGPMRELVVAMVDIDHFKAVNDTHGHDVGDAALAAVAWTLRDQIRDGDFVARWGGEEFVVIFGVAGIEQAEIAAERCRAAIAEARPRREEDPWFPEVTASFGMAARRPGDTPADIMKRADEQLYRAKAEGRDRVCVEPALLPGETRSGQPNVSH